QWHQVNLRQQEPHSRSARLWSAKVENLRRSRLPLRLNTQTFSWEVTPDKPLYLSGQQAQSEILRYFRLIQAAKPCHKILFFHTQAFAVGHASRTTRLSLPIKVASH